MAPAVTYFSSILPTASCPAILLNTNARNTDTAFGAVT
jgi:hypothetical protein